MHGLLIGRFQPFHLGHLSAVEHALKHVDKLWIVIGSAQKSHEYRNPFTAGERIEMIKSTLDEYGIDAKRWHAIPVYDADIHYLWIMQVNMLVPYYDLVFTNEPFTQLLFKEHGKEVREVPLLNRSMLSGTEVRGRMAEDREWRSLLPEEVTKVIDRVKGVERIKVLYRLSESSKHNPYHH